MTARIMFEDPWGNVFKTEQDYKAALAEYFEDNHEEIIAKEMAIPNKVMDWITSDTQRAISFGVTFKDDIYRIMETWIRNNWHERYEFYI